MRWNEWLGAYILFDLMRRKRLEVTANMLLGKKGERETTEAEVFRIAKLLIQLGLITQEGTGNDVFLTITPAGVKLCEELKERLDQLVD